MRKNFALLFFLTAYFIKINSVVAQEYTLTFSSYLIQYSVSDLPEKIIINFSINFPNDTIIPIYFTDRDYKEYMHSKKIISSCAPLRHDISWTIFMNNGDSIQSKKCGIIYGKYVGKYKKIKLKLKGSELLQYEQEINVSKDMIHKCLSRNDNNEIKINHIIIDFTNQYDFKKKEYSEKIIDQKNYLIKFIVVR